VSPIPPARKKRKGDRGVQFDGAFIADDLGSTRSPLISPQMYRRLVQPHHRRLFQHLAADGVRTLLHSDGNVAPLIPHFLEAGIRGLHPLEAKAGFHVQELRRQYGADLVLFGNVDVRALAGTPDDVAREVREKVTIGKTGGGHIFHSDHSVPHNVPLANYRLALETAREYGNY
jgi:uroporphyrinogen decarboxylase